jgi:hypothetical protein
MVRPTRHARTEAVENARRRQFLLRMREDNVNENCYQMKSMKTSRQRWKGQWAGLACAAASKARASKASMLALN